MEYKYCPECGQKLPANATFCTNCGTKQPLTNNLNNNSTFNEQNNEQQPVQNGAQDFAQSNFSSTPNKDMHSENVTGEATQTCEAQRASEQTPHHFNNDERFRTDNQTEPPASEQQQFFNANAHQQEQRQFQQPEQPQFFNAGSNQRRDYQHDNGQQFSQQQGRAYAYNESGRPGLNASFDIWMRCFGKGNKCMGRADYWWGYLAFDLVYLIASLCLGLLVVLLPQSVEIFYALYEIIYLIFCLFFILASIQRLHDTSHSGWNFCWILTGIGSFYVLYLLVQPTNWNQQRWVRE